MIHWSGVFLSISGHTDSLFICNYAMSYIHKLVELAVVYLQWVLLAECQVDVKSSNWLQVLGSFFFKINQVSSIEEKVLKEKLDVWCNITVICNDKSSPPFGYEAKWIINIVNIIT